MKERKRKMISWETVGVSAFITLIFAVAILLIIRKRIDSEASQFTEDMEVERTCRIDNDGVIRDMLKESYVKVERIDELECKYDQKFTDLEGNIDYDRIQLYSTIKRIDVLDNELQARINYDRTKLDSAVERIDDLDKKFNDVLIAKSVEHPETFRSRAAEGRCVFCGKKVDPVFIMPLMINTKALTYANGQELYTCEECYKKFDQFIAERRA
jgi:hypothetical protein